MKVTIRPLVENDAYISVKWRNMPEIWQYTAYKWTREIHIEDELNWIRKVIADPSGRRFAIIADDNYVGNIYLTNIKNGTGEYSIFIGEKGYWGKGIARKASEQIIAFAREMLHLKSIILGVNESNVAAATLYRSLGFRPTGKDEQFTWMQLDL
jgi:RimJ/RimL family protein N-acetyltransferase